VYVFAERGRYYVTIHCRSGSGIFWVGVYPRAKPLSEGGMYLRFSVEEKWKLDNA